MIEDFLWWIAEKGWLNGVCVSVCLSKHFGTWRTNGWADRDWKGIIRRARTAEGRWCQFWSDWWQVARETCDLADSYKNLLTGLQV